MTVTLAAERIAASCPGWAVRSIECLGEGDFCILYLVNGGWVFRFAKHQKAVHSLWREARLLPQIVDQFDVRIPAPQLIHLEREPAFVAYPLLPGLELSRERYMALPEADRIRCARQVADFMVQMHSTHLSLARQCDLEVIDFPARYHDLMARGHRRLFAEVAALDRSFVERAIAMSATSRSDSGFRPVLLHGDLTPGHVLYDEASASVTGIIDFGDMAIGDPAWDFVFLYEDYGLDFFSRVVRAYLRDSESSPERIDRFLERVYRFYVLDAIEWVVQCAERASTELDEAHAQLRRLRELGDEPLQELLSACGVTEHR